MAFRKFYLYRTNNSQSYLATSPAFAKRFFSSRGEITLALFCGETLPPMRAVERIAKGVYTYRRLP